MKARARPSQQPLWSSPSRFSVCGRTRAFFYWVPIMSEDLFCKRCGETENLETAPCFDGSRTMRKCPAVPAGRSSSSCQNQRITGKGHRTSTHLKAFQWLAVSFAGALSICWAFTKFSRSTTLLRFSMAGRTPQAIFGCYARTATKPFTIAEHTSMSTRKGP